MPLNDVLTAADVAELRADVVESFFDDFQLVRAVQVPDGAGGETETDTIIASGSCELVDINAMRRANLTTQQDIMTATVPWIVNLPYGTPIQAGDRLIVNGRTLRVNSSITPGNSGMYTSCGCQEIR